MPVVDAHCPQCETPLWIDLKLEVAEERPAEPKPYILGLEIENFICHAIEILHLSYSDTGKLLVTLMIQPEPGKSWHAHTVRALHRRIMKKHQEEILERWKQRQGE